VPIHLIETVRVVNGRTPLWPLHLARIERSCTALGRAFPTLVPPHGGPDRVCRYEITDDGVKVSERDVGAVRPVRLMTSGVGHTPYPHKTTDRACFNQAGQEATNARMDDAVLLTPEGWVAEGTIWSVCWWEMGVLCAPALSLGILPGVGRARVFEIRRHIVERKVTRRALTGVSLFLVNSARGVVEVESWDGDRVPKSQETARLAAQFWP
jgi:branched-subunit amino acid aminotransferase/4-amino-4-deoxychorismate lyase